MSGAAKRAIVVQTECVECQLRVHWRVTEPHRDKEDWAPIDAPSSFACPHWTEHHEAGFRSRQSPDGVASVGPVTARVLTQPPPSP